MRRDEPSLDRRLVSIRRVAPQGAFRRFAQLLLATVVATLVGLVLVPWQQSIRGRGRVTALVPAERPQSLEAPIPGRIAGWKVREGEAVAEGQDLVDLEDLDSKFLDPEQPARLRAQRDALGQQLGAARDKVTALEEQQVAQEAYNAALLESVRQKVAQAEDKRRQAVATREAAVQEVATQEANEVRVRALQQKGLRSDRDLELAQLATVKARAEAEKAAAAEQVAVRDLDLARLETDKTRSENVAKLAALRGYVAEGREKIGKLDSELAKLEVELSNLALRVGQRRVRAPSAGIVVRILKAGAGETVKQGDILAVLAPETRNPAVELSISDHDAPLVGPGRPVRLQFAGFPALQFSGWPRVAVGTFGGTVQLVDAVDQAPGKFRVLVTPAPGEAPWPDPAQLRPGSQAEGWILLETVSLGWELWRRFNDFPPSLEEAKGPAAGAKAGKP